MLMEAVDHYLYVRRALGYRLESAEWHLRSYARFATERGDHYIAVRTAIAWAEQSPSQHQRHRRLRRIIDLARFLHAEDGRHEIPPDGVFCGQQHRPVPYIFADEEIRLLLREAGRLGPPGSLRPHTYQTLFGILAVSGLRVSEALSLRIHDFTPDGLVIRRAKFQKHRLVPLHETSVAMLGRYLGRRRLIAGNDDHIFVSLRRRKLSYGIVIQTFHELCTAAGLPRQAGAWNLRLLDLRHTLAVRALEASPDDRDRVAQHMLALTTYLGHACIQSTYWYLEATPQLMKDIASRCEAFVKGEEQ